MFRRSPRSGRRLTSATETAPTIKAEQTKRKTWSDVKARLEAFSRCSTIWSAATRWTSSFASPSVKREHATAALEQARDSGCPVRVLLDENLGGQSLRHLHALSALSERRRARIG